MKISREPAGATTVCASTMMLATPQPQGAYARAVHRQQCLDQAARCRRLAYSISDQQASAALLAMAEDYERSAWGQRTSS